MALAAAAAHSSFLPTDNNNKNNNNNMPTWRCRYPSPLVKQDLAKLGRDGETRRAAMASLKAIVEEHLHDRGSSDGGNGGGGNVAKFLQQVEESLEGRRHAVAIVEMLAKVRGLKLAPHIPRLVNLLVQHGLLASTGCPALLPACASCMCSIAANAISSQQQQQQLHGIPRQEEEEEDKVPGEMNAAVLRQICLPLISLLPNKVPPLASGAASCLKSLVDSPTWRQSAPHALVQELCYKAAMAASSSSIPSLSHLLLLRSLASAHPSSIAKLAPSLLRLSIAVLLPHPFSASTATWQLRLAALHLLEALLVKASDHALLSAHLGPSLAALDKCRRHEKLPQLRSAVLRSLHVLHTLREQHSLISRTSSLHPPHGCEAAAAAVPGNPGSKFSDDGPIHLHDRRFKLNPVVPKMLEQHSLISRTSALNPSHGCEPAAPGNPGSKFSDDGPTQLHDRRFKLNPVVPKMLAAAPDRPQISVVDLFLESPGKSKNQNVSPVVEPNLKPPAVPNNRQKMARIDESEFFRSYFGEVDSVQHYEHHLEDKGIENARNPRCPLLTSSTGSQIRQRKVVHHMISEANMDPVLEDHDAQGSTLKGRSSDSELNFMKNTSCEQPLPLPPSASNSLGSSSMGLSKKAREIKVLGSNSELLAACEKNSRDYANNTTACTSTSLMMLKKQDSAADAGSDTRSTRCRPSDLNIMGLNEDHSSRTARGQSAEAHINADDGERICSPKLVLDAGYGMDKNEVDDGLSPCLEPSNGESCHRNGHDHKDADLHHARDCRNNSPSDEDVDIIATNYTGEVDEDNKTDSTLFHFNLDATTLHCKCPMVSDVQEGHEKTVLSLGSRDMLDEEEVPSTMSTDPTMAHEYTSEADTSSGEWSVRDNPIAEDHVITMSDASTSCNQRSSELLCALRWSMPQIPCIIDMSREPRDRQRRLSEGNRIRKEEINFEGIRITCHEEFLEAVGDNSAFLQRSQDNRRSAEPSASDEFSWIEIEELNPIQEESDNFLIASSSELPYYIPHKTRSISRCGVNKQPTSSKALVYLGLFFPIAMMILSRCSLHNDDIGHFLPPT